MFIPLNHKITNESGSKSKIKLSTEPNNIVFIPKGEDIETSAYLKNKLGVIVELVD